MASKKFTIRFLACVSAFAAIIILVFTCIMGASWPIAVFFAAAIAGVDILAFRNLSLCKPPLEQTLAPLPSPPSRKIWLALLVVSVLIAFAGLSMLLYSSWLSGDDFVGLGISALPLEDWIKTVGGSYFHWVSRLGEIVANIGTISFSRWQIWLLTPLLLVSIPFAVWKLVRKREPSSICSPGGILFFWFIILLFLIPESKGWWQALSVYVVGTNYLWPSVATLFLMAVIVRAKDVQPTPSPARFLLQCLAMFALGTACGWGNECTTVFLVPFVFAWLAYHCHKKIRIPAHVLPACLGVIVGAMMLFLSTAHAFRAVKAESFRAIRPENMPYDQVVNFVQHLTPDKVAMLGGDNVILTGIPMYLHIYFLPYMTKLFLPIALPFMVALVLMLCCLVRHPRFKCIFLLSCLALAASWVVASSYLAQCIPTAMSFVPPAFLILAACGMAFVYLNNWQKVVMLLVSVIAFCLTTLPAAHEAFVYKQYEQASYADVFLQIAEGKKDVVFHCMYTKQPENRLGIIDNRTISADNPLDIYNKSLARWLGVNSILRENPPAPCNSGKP